MEPAFLLEASREAWREGGREGGREVSGGNRACLLVQGREGEREGGREGKRGGTCLDLLQGGLQGEGVSEETVQSLRRGSGDLLVPR